MKAVRAVAILVSLSVATTAAAEYVISQSVVANGGGEASGPSHVIVGTAGQAAIGVVSGPSYTNEIGFWYQPGWILTEVEDGVLPTRFLLDQNFPNPFKPVSTLRFGVPEQARVAIRLYDVAGREVRTLADEEFDPGYHWIVIDGSGLASGVYFCRMEAASFREVTKLILLK
jgi:hypothetical protein